MNSNQTLDANTEKRFNVKAKRIKNFFISPYPLEFRTNITLFLVFQTFCRIFAANLRQLI